MKILSGVFFTFIFLSGTTPAFTQRITVFGDAPVRVDGEGFLVNLMREGMILDDVGKCPIQKVVPVYMAGGWIAMQTTNSPFGSSLSFSSKDKSFDPLYLNHYKSHKLYSRLFYTKTPISGQTYVPHADSLQTIDNRILLGENSIIAYCFLRVNDYFFVDFLDRDTDTLVTRYYIKRVKTVPVVKGYYQQDGNELLKVNYSHSENLVPGQRDISLFPDRKIQFILPEIPVLSDSLIRYDLVNLKTGDTLHYTGGGQISVPKLNAGNRYVLHFYYLYQPESVAAYALNVIPYWYRSRLFYLLVGVFVSGISGLIIASTLRRRTRRLLQEQAETEQHLRMVQSQLNPHFTFNALSSIQGLMNTERIVEANHYLREFSMLLRNTLARNEHMYNTLDRELDMMKTYIGLEQLRFSFKWNLRISPTINPSDIEIPTLLLQPLIENAIKHGISESGVDGFLAINCLHERLSGDLTIQIKDNGRGFNQEINTGFGLKLSRERIDAVNKLLRGKKIDLLFKTEDGAEATIIFQNWIDNQ